MNTVLIKVGSESASEKNLKLLARAVKYLKENNFSVTIVGSGAKKFDREKNPHQYSSGNPTRRVARTRGQIELIKAYNEAFKECGLDVGQLLVTREELGNVKGLLDEMNSQNTIPVINENSPLTDESTTFGDNDKLAAELAQKINPEKLIFVTSSGGLYKDYGKATQELLKRVSYADAYEHVKNEKSETGTGGMEPKIDACRTAKKNCIITSADKLLGVLKNETGEYTTILFE